jgi:phage/plasmid-like protein (TIGR03299 family)
MSRETQEWLENNILVGFTEKRGSAWWYRGVDRTDGTPNHFTGAIPVGTVQEKLFDWEPVTAPVYYESGIDEWTEIPGKKRVYASDNIHHTFGIFSDTYEPHGFSEWLIGNVSNILQDTLSISSAGLLRNRAVAWVEISVPENVTTPEGVTFRPNLLATTSLDGTIATTYKRTQTMTVCDNTYAMAMAEQGQTYKRRHTKFSNTKAEQDRAREILGLLARDAETVADTIRDLCHTEVSEIQFKEVLRLAIPFDPESKTGVTVAEKKMNEIEALYRNDERVAPWSGTAFGVVQAFNTWDHHLKSTRGETNRVERNMYAAVSGQRDKADAQIMTFLKQALETV